MDAINQHAREHQAFRDSQYEAGHFLLSGRKDSQTGGYILATANCQADLETLIQNDPLYIYQISEYNITAFTPSKADKRLAFLLEE